MLDDLLLGTTFELIARALAQRRQEAGGGTKRRRRYPYFDGPTTDELAAASREQLERMQRLLAPPRLRETREERASRLRAIEYATGLRWRDTDPRSHEYLWEREMRRRERRRRRRK